MTRFEIAHIQKQGQNMIIVPVTHAFGAKSRSEQTAIIERLQIAARAAGLAGTVIPIWNASGRMMFIAPQPWHPFFRSISSTFVAANINKSLTISD